MLKNKTASKSCVLIAMYSLLIGIICGLYAFSAKNFIVKKYNNNACIKCYEDGIIDTINGLNDYTGLPYFKNYEELKNYIIEQERKKELYSGETKIVGENNF